MKQLIKTIMVLLIAALCSCQPTGQNTKSTTSQPYNKVMLVIIIDNSGSFANRYKKLTPEELKPLVDKISNSCAFDLRVGIISSDSHTEFIRYAAERSQSNEATQNPWMTTGEGNTSGKNNWNEFSAAMQHLMSEAPSKRSDIGGALSHALLIFNEAKTPVRKILLLATDYKNNVHPIPAIHKDIEVISIGALPDIPIEKKLQTENVHRFESFTTAIDFISSSF